MKVELINYTQNAMELLIFTKETRLNMESGNMMKIAAMPYQAKLAKIEEMSKTIPSSWEFVDYVFLISGVTRAFTHQFVRTRTGSYAQQSMRVTDQTGFETRVPATVRMNEEAFRDWADTMADLNAQYKDLIARGIPVEDARGILPTNILTNIVAKFNLRTLSEMGRSRTGARTQDEYREVMDGMLKEVLDVHPWATFFLIPPQQDHLLALERIIEKEVKASKPKVAQDLFKLIDQLRKKR